MPELGTGSITVKQTEPTIPERSDSYFLRLIKGSNSIAMSPTGRSMPNYVNCILRTRCCRYVAPLLQTNVRERRVHEQASELLDITGKATLWGGQTPKKTIWNGSFRTMTTVSHTYH